ncbi:MAG: TauD/TfdA family dioxygenase [Methyloligellaceae bacterium]
MHALAIDLEGADRARTVLDAVAETGYCVFPTGQTYEAFLEFCKELGDVFHISEVKIGGPRPRAYQRSDEIPYHTDHISAQVAVWYCHQPEPTGNEMRLIDLAQVAMRLDAHELEALGRATTHIRKPEHGVWEEGHIPVYQTEGSRQLFHYVDWADPDCPDAAAEDAVAAFKRHLREAMEAAVVEADLQPGDALFIDNNRILHGRRALPTDSKRHLKRIWIRDALN